jgi:ATP-dependent RNA helicase DDX10/DBP4
MFERKNQNVFTPHYTKLVDRSTDSVPGDADADDFITLKRADHELSDAEHTGSDSHAANLSKRKLKLGKAKRAVAKYGGLAQKVIFDEEGNPHEMYEMDDAEEFFKDGLEGAKEAGKRFAEGERGKMRKADVVDKEQAKEKKNERKRKRKQKEKMVSYSTFYPFVLLGRLMIIPQKPTTSGSTITPLPDDGYVSPVFDSFSDDDERDAPPKRRTL